MNKRAAELSIRFFSVTTAIGRGALGNSTGSTRILDPIGPNRSTDSGMIVR